MKAIELAPSDATAHQWYGQFLWTMTESERGTDALRRAQELDPLSLIGSVIGTWSDSYSGRYGKVVERLENVLAMEPNYAPALRMLGMAYAELGRWDEAIAALEKGRSLDNSAAAVQALGRTYARTGNRMKARQTLRVLQEMSTTRYVDPYNFVAVYVGLGEFDDAVDYSEQGIVIGPAHVVARVELGAALFDEDVAGQDALAAELLDAEVFRITVAPVATRSDAFLMCHIDLSRRLRR